ncbi:MAG: hypothetical protein DRJ35_00200 [Thermoprotei archaeon]|nr:MAG: hypothetical protein DRJ35_00200 [Thermoprotei archaeon]
MKKGNNGTFVVTLKHLLSDCSFYETITVLENIGAKIEDVLDRRIIRFETSLDTGLIIDYLYRLTSVEYLLKEIALCKNLEKHVVKISRSIKNSRYMDIVFLDPYNNYSKEKKDEIKQKLIQVIQVYNKNIKLSRKEPDIRLFVLALDKEIFTVNIHIKTFRRDRFKFRSPEKRVYFQSSALNPQSSLLLINLAILQSNSETVVLDPFCGTGSILIEASLQGHYCIGVDLDYKMIMGAKRNLKQYNVYHQADLILADSLLIPLRDESVNAIATDPPYGRLASTKGKPREKIFYGITEVSKRVLKRGGKTAFFLPAPEVLEKDERLRRRKVCSIYLHSDLTRNVWVIEKCS